MMETWLKALLAVSALGGGPVWAEGAQGFPVQTLQVMREEQGSSPRAWGNWSLESGGARVEVASTRGFEPGAWTLVLPRDGGTSSPWELAQVRSAGEGSLELSGPLAGLHRTVGAQVELLGVSQQPEGTATAGLDRPRQGAQVSDRALSVAGWAERGSRVLVFVDGLEAARLETDDSGRFAGGIEKPLAPGSHQLQVVSGLEGAWSLQPESVFVVSLAPPADPVVTEPANGAYTNDTTPLFRGTAQPGTQVIVAISGTDVGSTVVDAAGDWSLSLATALAEGSYSASVRAQSSGGETSGEIVLSFTVDVTPPTTTFTQFPAEVTRSTSETFRWKASSDALRFECKLDGSSYVACIYPYQITDLAEGTHVMRIRATDQAGNVELEPASVTWSIDHTPPTMRIVNPPPEWSNDRNPIFNFEANEIVGYSCTLDSSYNYNCDETPSVQLNSLSEGPHVLEVYAYDRVGWVSQTVTLSWNVDLTPPSAPVLQQPSAGALLSSRFPTISGTAEPGGAVRVIINDVQIGSAEVGASGDWTLDWTGITTGGLATGSYELVLVALDQAGNSSMGSTPVSFDVDVDRPDTFITEGPDAVIRDERPHFRFSSTEEGVSYECSVNEEQFGACDELVEGSRSFEPGAYMLQVRARDRAGNVDDTPDTWTWTYSTAVGSGGGFLGCSASGSSPWLSLVALLAFLTRRGQRSAQREAAGYSGLLAVLMILLVVPARAQGVDLQRYKPAPGSNDMLGVHSPRVERGLGLHAGLSVNYARNPLVLRNASDSRLVQSIVADQLTADVLASVSFLEYFELGLALPVTGQWGPAASVFTPENATGTGLGDLRLVPKAGWKFLDGGLSLGAAAVLSLPTANNQSFLGTGALGVQPMVLAQWAPSTQLKLLANVGGRFQPERRVELLDLRVGNELTYALGTQWSPANSKLSVQASVAGAFGLQQQAGSRPLEVLAAVGYALPGGMRVQVGGGPGLTGGYGTPNFRLFASIDWVSSPTGSRDADDDKDEVANDKDTCPYEKGDRGDGCPKDGGAERVNALAQLFKNNSDTDEFLDDEDACPSEPGVRERRGCAIPPQPAVDEAVVTLSFSTGKLQRDSAKELDEKVVARVKELLESNQLVAVHVSFPSEQKAAKLMQKLATRVSDDLAQKVPELKNSDKLKVKFNGSSPPRKEKKKDIIDVAFTFSRPSVPEPPQPELTCAQGVSARLMWPDDEVTGVSKDKKVCAGHEVKTGPAGAVLVLRDGKVLRVAPKSQVMLRNDGGVEQGIAEPRASRAALDAPEILPPCTGPISNSSRISWQKVSGAERYWVQVARGVDFVSDVHFVLTEETEVPLASLNLPKSGKWYWRVLPVDKEGLVGQPSKIHAFEVSEAVSMRN